MKPYRSFPAACFAAVLVLASCTHTPAPVRTTAADATLLAAQSAREAALADTPAWSLVGRLAVDAAGEGGSGRIEWAQAGDDFTIRLSAPVTRRSWQLERHGGVVVLSGLDGGERRGTDAEAMLFDATGWRIPVDALAAWARGARAGGPATIEFGPEGLPALSGTAFEGMGIVVFAIAIATLALVTLPYASERPIRADRWTSYAFLAAAGWLALGYRVIDLASLRAFSFTEPADVVTAIPGLWLVVIGLAMLSRATYEMLQEPQLR